MVQSKVIVLANPPNRGNIDASTFRVETQSVGDDLSPGQVLIKVLALGNEPAQKTWMDEEIDPKRLYAPPIKRGDVVRAPAIGEVVQSRSDKWKEGQRVTGFFGWREYAVVDEKEITEPAADIPGQSPWISLGGLGLTGRTAWVGAFRELNLKPEHTLLVSGAAGAVGMALVQIAKNVVGCKRVVGIAGGDEKCDFVKKLGADACVDYKKASFAQDLKKALSEDGSSDGEADVFFDNVGGDVLNEALTVIKRYGFVSVCGAISGYHGSPLELTNWREVVYNRITLKGFILFDHVSDLGRAGEELTQWVKEGKLNVERETVVDTKFEDVPKTWQRLFSGDNTGKLVTKLV